MGILNTRWQAAKEKLDKQAAELATLRKLGQDKENEILELKQQLAGSELKNSDNATKISVLQTAVDLVKAALGELPDKEDADALIDMGNLDKIGNEST